MRRSSGTPQVSSASTSACAARTGTSSVLRPVRTLTTPPGTSEVASTSASVTAGSGRRSLAMRTTALPVTSGGASRLTRPSSDEVSGATTPTTPVGSGIVKLKYGAATGLDEPRTWAILSAQPAYQTQRSMARSTTARGRRRDAGPRRPRPRRRTARAGPPSARRRGRGPGRGSSRSWRPSPRTPCARGPRRGGPCATPGRRWRGACRRRRRRGTSGRTRSAGTPRRCRACRSCGPRSSRGAGVASGRHQRSSSRTYASRPCRPPSRPNPISL